MVSGKELGADPLVAWWPPFLGLTRIFGLGGGDGVGDGDPASDVGGGGRGLGRFDAGAGAQRAGDHFQAGVRGGGWETGMRALGDIVIEFGDWQAPAMETDA